MSERSKSVKECLNHLNKIGVDTREFMQAQFSTFFLEYVPLDIINTLFTVYLNEGIKIMFRIGYAFFKILKEQIICSSSSEEFDVVARETLEQMSDEGKKRFVNQCFHLRIVRIKKQFSLLDTKNNGQSRSYILEASVLNETKILLDETVVKEIYKMVPNIIKANDLKRIFSDWHDGHSLNQMIIKAEEAYEDGSSFLLVIEDTDGGIFGAFLNHELGKTSPTKKLGSSDNFVFSFCEDGPKFFRA